MDEKMTFKLEDDYIELYKLLKVLDLVDSGGQAKMIVADGYVLRNGETELRKRAKIIKGDVLVVGDDVTIEVI
jgi:ribosome-associated protein